MKQVKVGNVKLPVNKDNERFIPDHKQEIVGYRNTLSRLAYAVKSDKPTLMIGETGVGKTALVRYLAQKTNNGFRRLNLNGQTTTDEFVGRTLLNKEGTYWQDGVLTDSLRNGYWLLLDEINAALPEIHFVLHSLLDDDGYIVLAENEGEIIKPHENFRLFATMNPSGKYAGTKRLNKAFFSRFPMILQIDFPTENEEKAILQLYSDLDEQSILNLVKLGNDLRESYKKDEIEFVCSPRDLINCARVAEDLGMPEAIRTVILNRCQPEDLKTVKTATKLYFNEDGNPEPKVDYEEKYFEREEKIASLTREKEGVEKELKEAKEKIGEHNKVVEKLEKERRDIESKIKRAKDLSKDALKQIEALSEMMEGRFHKTKARGVVDIALADLYKLDKLND